MAACLLASVWCLLLLASALGSPLGAAPARGVAYAACTALLLASRPPRRRRAAPRGALLAAASGFAALPAWLAAIGALGTALGLGAPVARGAAPGAGAWLAHVALAPVFEELLYRERVLPALRTRLGAPLALVVSSALFAAPHLEAWSVLATFGVGLALGGVFLATGRVELCIAHHAGLNAAALACGLPPARAALPPAASALAAALGLALACAWTRGHGAWTRGRGTPPPALPARLHRAWRLHRSRACRPSHSEP